MKLFQRAALWASISLLTALTACSNAPTPIFQTPPLNAADRAHLTCAAFPDIKETLRELPAHVFLSGSSGAAVTTPDGHKWVRWDIVNQREGILVKFGDITARGAHFECRDDLQWLGRVWTELEKKP